MPAKLTHLRVQHPNRKRDVVPLKAATPAAISAEVQERAARFARILGQELARQGLPPLRP